MRLNPWFVFPVLTAGVAGALIGANVARVTCAPVDVEAACDSPELAFGIIGAVVAMVGVGVVVALVLRSLAEWRDMSKDRDEEG